MLCCIPARRYIDPLVTTVQMYGQYHSKCTKHSICKRQFELIFWEWGTIASSDLVPLRRGYPSHNLLPSWPRAPKFRLLSITLSGPGDASDICSVISAPVFSIVRCRQRTVNGCHAWALVSVNLSVMVRCLPRIAGWVVYPAHEPLGNSTF